MPQVEYVPLTDEQAAVVAHNEGPALVFAVAGAGKTTSMVRRLERLVREKVFRAERILATSFGKQNVDDLKKALSHYPHASRVHVKTLHGFSYQILRDVMRHGKIAEQSLGDDVENAPHVILNGALSLARNSSFRAELDTLDRDDFLNYVGANKSQLLFLPERFKKLPQKTQAGEIDFSPHIPWYYDLYEFYETVRLERKLLTFDDFVPEAWALLVQQPDLAERHQRMYDAVLIDEYQDVNLGQVELLDILIRGHKNVMAIGDDDQAIYGFRGASNQYIMGFAKRYGAQAYIISDNFRCNLEHTLLANHVIARNKVRAPKLLCAARGFGGAASLTTHDSNASMGEVIATNIETAIDGGLRADQVAVLVRLYAETASIESALIERGVSYKISGSVPFFERRENVLLLQYLEVGLIETRMSKGKLSAEDKAKLSGIWWDVLRTPKRYLKRETSDVLLRQVLQGTPPSVALLSAGGLNGFAGERLVTLGEILAWLVEALEQKQTASMILRQLEDHLGYKDFLIDNSGFLETGQGKAQNVDAFLDYTKGKGEAEDLLRHITRVKDLHRGTRGAAVNIFSIFKAKGLEWPYVIVPAVNYGHIPAGRDASELAEERRLFYVALTRTQKTLELHVVKERPPSIFTEGLQDLVNAGPKLSQALSQPPSKWSATEALSVVASYPSLERYCKAWLDLDEAEQHQLEGWVLAANQALGMKTVSPLPRPFEQALRTRVDLDKDKLSACAQAAGVGHKLTRPALSSPNNRRAYRPGSDGTLQRGTRVWHKLHGSGQVVFAGPERGSEVIEVAFDKGRTSKFVKERASLEIMA